MRRFWASWALVCAVAGSARAATGAGALVVLPFFNLSSNPNLNWIGESLSESIHDALAASGVLVLDRDERIEAYRQLSIRPYVLLTSASVLKIADRLGAESVVSGQFNLKNTADTRGTLEITAQLLDLKGGRRVAEFTESGPLEDLAVLQRRLAWRTLKAASPGSAPAQEEYERRHPGVRLDAMEQYVRGLLAATFAEKHRLFTQAARLDSSFSQPCYQLGKLYVGKKDFKVAAEWLGRIPPEDPHVREAKFLLGLCLFHTGDFAGAQAAFQTVASSIPLNEVFNNIGACQSRQNLPQAVDSFKKALDGDPSDPAYQFNVGYALWRRGDFEGAAARFRAVLERDPQDQEAAEMLDRSVNQSGPRAGDTKTDRLERLKTNYEESAWQQLKAVLKSDKP